MIPPHWSTADPAPPTHRPSPIEIEESANGLLPDASYKVDATLAANGLLPDASYKVDATPAANRLLPDASYKVDASLERPMSDRESTSGRR